MFGAFQFINLREYVRPHDEVYRDISENRQFNAVYLMMLVLAALIALLGLLLNSPAIIIGAMLISPLMGPILGGGLALTLADWDLGRKSLRNIALSVIEAIAITAIATWLSPLREATPEILARTNPNLMDLLVAVFSGLAGTLALCSRTAGMTIIPGVAIATAVMPPLATTGYGIATGQWQIAGGAFMLFVTNLTAIVVSADLMFLLAGFRPQEELVKREHRLLMKYRIVIAGVILAILAVPLLRTLMRGAQQASLRKQVTDTLRADLESGVNTRVAAVDLAGTAGGITVDAYVRTTQYIERQRVRQLEEKLTQRVGRPVRLNLLQVRVELDSASEMAQARNDFLTGGVVRPLAPAETMLPARDLLSSVQARVQAALERYLKPMKVESLRVLSMSRQEDESIAVQITAVEPAPLEAASWAVVAAAVAQELKVPVRITGTLTIAGEGEPLEFPAGSDRPSRRAVQQVRATVAKWQAARDLRVAVRASALADPALTAQRLSWLRENLGMPVSDSLSLDPTLEENVMRLQRLQAVDASGQYAPPTSPGAPPAASAAPAR